MSCRCHEGYNLDVYPPETVMVPAREQQAALTLQAMNTQVAEQCNAQLERIATQVAYMSQPNVMRYSKYYLYRYNEKMLAKLQAG